ncbi:hypothetical protein YC2023_039585 [Brassica napus]
MSSSELAIPDFQWFYLPANEALRFLPKERLGNLQFLQRGDLPPSDPSSCTHIPGGHGPPCPVQ